MRLDSGEAFEHIEHIAKDRDVPVSDEQLYVANTYETLWPLAMGSGERSLPPRLSYANWEWFEWPRAKPARGIIVTQHGRCGRSLYR